MGNLDAGEALGLRKRILGWLGSPALEESHQKCPGDLRSPTACHTATGRLCHSGFLSLGLLLPRRAEHFESCMRASSWFTSFSTMAPCSDCSPHRTALASLIKNTTQSMLAYATSGLSSPAAKGRQVKATHLLGPEVQASSSQAGSPSRGDLADCSTQANSCRMSGAGCVFQPSSEARSSRRVDRSSVLCEYCP